MQWRTTNGKHLKHQRQTQKEAINDNVKRSRVSVKPSPNSFPFHIPLADTNPYQHRLQVSRLSEKPSCLTKGPADWWFASIKWLSFHFRTNLKILSLVTSQHLIHWDNLCIVVLTGISDANVYQWVFTSNYYQFLMKSHIAVTTAML